MTNPSTPTHRPKAAVCRADLLRCLARGDPGALGDLADLAGFRRLPTDRGQQHAGASDDHSASDLAGGTGAQPPGILERPPTATAPVTGLPFYRAVSIRRIERAEPPGEVPDWYREATPPSPGQRRPEQETPPTPEPLLPWARLWPFLRAALGEDTEDREPDLARLVADIARGRAPRRLPRRRRRRWSIRCRLVLDLSPRLRAFHHDGYDLVPRLERLRGRLGLEVLLLHDGPDGPVRALGDPRPRPPGSLLADWTPDLPLLVLGDLGCLGRPAERAAWRRIGRRCRRAGRLPVALLPCPSRCWDHRLAADWHAVCWDRGELPPRRLDPRHPRRTQWPAERADLAADPAGDQGAALLLALLAPAALLEPALVRALRHRLATQGGPLLDVGAEAALWQHPSLLPTAAGLVWADQSAAAAAADAHRAQTPAGRALAAALIDRYHRHLPPSVRALERAALADLEGTELDAASKDYLAGTLALLEQGGGESRAIARHAERLGEWLDPRALQPDAQGRWGADDGRRGALWVAAHRERLRDGRVRLPAGLDLGAYDWLTQTGRASVRQWLLVQQGAALALVSPEDAGEYHRAPERFGGSPLATITVGDGPIQCTPQAPDAEPFSVPADARAHIPLADGGVMLSSGADELQVERFGKPAWAAGLHRDEHGLFATVQEGDGERLLRWVPPGHLGVLPLHQGDGGTASPYQVSFALYRGVFWDDKQYRRWLGAAEPRPPAWASAMGEDEFGLWAEFQVQRITQRLRWLWPGEFRMGSTPETDPEREHDETPHQVLLTRGFWLADTACTQALWEAVLGKRSNRSRFGGAEQPVKNVSFEDASKFLSRLGQRVPGLKPRLPTEAEWEYGCRAGTDTPFWFGDTITTEQANYNGNYPYGDGPKGESREQTVDVTALPCNGWGLYQMHGNVWEWCSDWYGDYAEGIAVDPRGAETGVRRVVRGGRWGFSAWLCRSAQRGRGEPGGRNDDRGFRLARDG